MLTGKQRYREQRRFLRPSLMVLQVQYRDREYDPFGGYAVTRWRDATVEDLLVTPAPIEQPAVTFS